jgi:hypothetical protein
VLIPIIIVRFGATWSDCTRPFDRLDPLDSFGSLSIVVSCCARFGLLDYSRS